MDESKEFENVEGRKTIHLQPRRAVARVRGIGWAAAVRHMARSRRASHAAVSPLPSSTAAFVHSATTIGASGSQKGGA